MAYATEEELNQYLDGDPTPRHPTRLLDQASIDIDLLLVGTIYDTDDDGIATDTDVAAAIKMATILQAVHIGIDPSGRKKQYSSMSSSQVSWTRATRADGSPVVEDYSAAAISRLRACPGLQWTWVRHG